MAPKQFTSEFAKPPTSSRPAFASVQPDFLHHLIRDSLPIQTWLALGAVLQTLLFIIPGVRRVYAILPVTALLVYQITSTALALYHVTQDVSMNNVIPTRYTAVIPDKQGNFSRGIGDKENDSPGGEGVAVFFLGFRCNQ